MHRPFRFLPLLVVVSLGLLVAGCDSSSDRTPISGDIAYRVEAASGVTFRRSTNYHTEQTIESESSTETIPGSGVFEGDLRDGVVGIEVTIREASNARLELLIDDNAVRSSQTGSGGTATVRFGDLFGASPQ